MKIILMQKVPKLGQRYSIVEVKRGYAQHYLIPKGLALVANQANRSIADTHQKLLLHQAEQTKKKAQIQAKRAAKLDLCLKTEVGQNGKIFSTFNAASIVAALKAQGLEITSKQVVLPKPIDAVGQHPVLLMLHPEVEVTVQVTVRKKQAH